MIRMINACGVAAALVMLPAAVAAPAAACESAEFRQFDFWLGDWEIEQHLTGPGGKDVALSAATSVTRAAGGCALVERWSGKVQFPWTGMTEPEPMQGLSVRYFNADEQRWYIHWLDSRNPHFGQPFTGNFDNGVGTFTLTRQTEKGPRESRIVFTQPANDRVHWELSMETGDGEWLTIWTMNMRRR